MEVIILKCPNCGAAVSTEQTKCQYCKKPVLIQRYEEAAEMPALQLNKYAAAYRKTLEENPNNREINLSVGACYLKLKMYDKALESLEKAMQDNFEDAEPYYLGAVALLQGRKAFVAQRVAIDKALEYLNAAVMINSNVWIEDSVCSHLHIYSYGNMWVDIAVVTYYGSFFDAGVGADVDIFSYLGCFSYGCQRTDTYFFRLVHFIKCHKFGQTFIGIFYLDECCTHFLFRFEILIYQYDGRLGSIYIMYVFGI